MDLTVQYWSRYLTNVDFQWRGGDHKVNKLVKLLKKHHFNGHVDVSYGGRIYPTRSDERGYALGLKKAARTLHQRIVEFTNIDVDVVPIPNSVATIDYNEEYRTLELARAIAGGSPDRIFVSDAIRWRNARDPSHAGGAVRDPQRHIFNMALVQPTTRPVVIVDDVLTTGSQMKAACKLLTDNGASVLGGVTYSRTVNDQSEPPIRWGSETYCQIEDEFFPSLFE